MKFREAVTIKFTDTVKNHPFFVAAVFFASAIAGITFLYSVPTAVVELLVVAVITGFSVKWYSDTMARKIDQVAILSDVLKTNDKCSPEMENFPFPVVLSDKDGKIIWFNSHFEVLIPDFSVLKNKNLKYLFNQDSEVAYRKENVIEVSGQKQQYTVFSSRLDNGLTAYYFVEDTKLKEYRYDYLISRPVVLLINIDSLEQAEDTMPHEDYYGLNSEVDKILTKWLVENNCVFRKFSDGRFFALTEKQHFDGIVNDKFAILDKIRSEKIGGEGVDITLSIGVGMGEDFAQSEDFAHEALDMARGRGGDQAAVKTKDNYEFFGGLSSGKEKRGKVKSRAFAAALDSYIENADDVLCMGHINSDFDAIGACIGVVAIARAKGKNAHIIVNRFTTLAENLIKMSETGAGAVSFISPEKAIQIVNKNTLLVICDTMQTNLAEARELLNYSLKTVLIDHHRKKPENEIKGETFEFHEPYASSTCEMVTELVEYSPSKPHLTPIQAQALLSGIILDTKNFALRVGVRTFEAASYLRECKADTVAVKKLFAGSAQMNVAVNNTVNSAVYYSNFAVAVSNYEGANAKIVASKAADELLCIEGVDASFVLTSIENGVHISARSLGKINVQLIMETLGGGGHLSMAATQIKNISADEAVRQLKLSIDKYFKTI